MTDSIDTLSWLLNKARSLGADAADAVMFETLDISSSRRLRQPEGLERSENKAVGLRTFIGSKQAMASTTDTLPQALTELAERAVAMAKAATEDADATLAPEALYCHAPPALDLFDSAPDNAWLEQQCAEAEEAALSIKGITNSEGADAQYHQNRISLAIHNGKQISFAKNYQSSHYSVSVSVLAGEGLTMERDYDFTSARHRNALMPAEAIGKSAAERALKRLNPRKVATCKVPVVFDPRLSRSLLSILASAISGTAIARGSSFLKQDLHKKIFPQNITIIDDPHIRAGLGSKPFDGEGVANRKQSVIENGVLTTWLLDMKSANKLKLQTTGHAARSISTPPSPAATNFYMENGTLSPAALMKDIKNGLYVSETFGMGINLVTGDYSQGAAGFWIENGEIAYPVSEITIAGHLRDMFAQMTPANDLAFRYATNAPTLRVETMTVAGS